LVHGQAAMAAELFSVTHRRFSKLSRFPEQLSDDLHDHWEEVSKLDRSSLFDQGNGF
jgi:hypothetical protein